MEDAHGEFFRDALQTQPGALNPQLGKTHPNNPGFQELVPCPQPTRVQAPRRHISHSRASGEMRERRLQPLGTRYTHTLPQLPASYRRTCLKSPCSSSPRPTSARPSCPAYAAGFKFPRRGRLAQPQRRWRPGSWLRLAAHLSPVSARRGGRARRSRSRGWSAEREGIPGCASSVLAGAQAAAAAGGASFRGEQLLA